MGKRLKKFDEKKYGEASLSGVNRPLSLVAQVERTLRTAIKDGFFPNGRLPTLIELADQLRVSRETVRLALDSLQKEGLVIKRRRRGTVVRIPEELAELTRPRAQVLGYLMEELDSAGGDGEIVSRPCSRLMLEGAILETSQLGYQLNIRSARSYQLRDTFTQMEASGPMCGLIFKTVVKEKFLKGLSGRGIPSILLDHELRLPNVGSIRSDSEQNASLAVRQLVKLGHQKIACAHWQQSDLNPWFLQGYRKGM